MLGSNTNPGAHWSKTDAPQAQRVYMEQSRGKGWKDTSLSLHSPGAPVEVGPGLEVVVVVGATVVTSGSS